MSYSFRKILVPVDFSINTEVALEKALEMADKFASLHLLHVQTYPSPDITSAMYGYVMNSVDEDQEIILMEKLRTLKKQVAILQPDLETSFSVAKGDSVQKAIEETAKEMDADLIVIGRNSNHSWLPFLNTVLPNSIAKHSGVAVLTVKPGAIHNKIKTMIVPITSDADKQKTEIISAICRKFRVKVYLVTFMNNENKPVDFNASSLLKVYQWLRTTLHCPVEYTVLHGHNKAKEILDYAKKIDADILLVHPETETKIGWFNKRISDVLPPESKVEVLAVQTA